MFYSSSYQKRGICKMERENWMKWSSCFPCICKRRSLSPDFLCIFCVPPFSASREFPGRQTGKRVTARNFKISLLSPLRFSRANEGSWRKEIKAGRNSGDKIYIALRKKKMGKNFFLVHSLPFQFAREHPSWENMMSPERISELDPQFSRPFLSIFFCREKIFQGWGIETAERK